MRTKKSLGQNFLFDPAILYRIIEASGVGPEDTVVEIGPGPGSLTRQLAAVAKKVVAIELDPDLYERLLDDTAGSGNVEVVYGDCLEYPYAELGPFKVVANIPYYITTPIIFKLLESGGMLKSMTLTIQKEVAERIAAPPGTRDYGVLSVAVQYRGRPELKFVIPREAFKPAPKVDSAVLRIDIHPAPAVSTEDEKLFFRVVRTAFGQRRKTLANALKPMAEGRDIKDILRSAGIDPMRRAETLCLEDFARIADVLVRSV